MNTNDPDLPNQDTPPISDPAVTSTPPNRDSLVQREDIMARAEDRRNICRILSRAHVLVSIRWSNTHLYIGIPSTVFAALAGVQAIADLGQEKNTWGTIIQIILSILVAGLAPLLTFLNPNERANTHQTASRVYEQIGDRYDAFLLQCLVESRGLKQELDDLVQLNLSYSEEKKPLPLTPEWAFQRAKQEQMIAPFAKEHKSQS
ncbi:SLATT domain-containing protein [Limnoraphis robusta CCNP1315]|uniref:SLATT domain-containing protein n=2 Tax=Limnoraphis TaxID=1332112 RepID=A0ABU5U3W3_9CYAN|nr:SLATT domain-containing protein [Limnoraphis robusta CCNP1315]